MISTTDYDNKKLFFFKDTPLKYNRTPLRCNHLILLYVTSGFIKIEVNYTVYNVTPNSLMLLSPLDIIIIKEVSEDFKDYKLIVPTSLFNNIYVSNDIKFYEMIKNHPLTAFAGKELKMVEGLFNTLSVSQEVLDYEHFERAALNCVAIFYQLCHQHLKNSGHNVRFVCESRKKTLFKKFVRELIVSHNKSREVLFYANELGVSAGYLNEVCNEIAGYSAKDIIDQAVSSRLKSELVYTDKSIQELADEYNFPSQSYFSRYYKRITGLSPTEFRKSKQENK